MKTEAPTTSDLMVDSVVLNGRVSNSMLLVHAKEMTTFRFIKQNKKVVVGVLHGMNSASVLQKRKTSTMNAKVI